MRLDTSSNRHRGKLAEGSWWGFFLSSFRLVISLDWDRCCSSHSIQVPAEQQCVEHSEQSWVSDELCSVVLMDRCFGSAADWYSIACFEPKAMTCKCTEVASSNRMQLGVISRLVWTRDSSRLLGRLFLGRTHWNDVVWFRIRSD